MGHDVFDPPGRHYRSFALRLMRPRLRCPHFTCGSGLAWWFVFVEIVRTVQRLLRGPR